MKKTQNCNSWEWLADKLWTFTPRDLTRIAIWHPYLLHPASNKSICPVSCKADWFLWESASSLFNQPTNLTFCWLICVGCCMVFLPLIKSTSKFQLYKCENNTVRLHKSQDEILTQTMELFLVQIIQDNPRNKLHQVWSPLKCHCHSYIWTKKLVNHNYNLVHLYPKLNSIFPTRFSYTPKKGHEVYTSYLKERVSFGSAFTKVILWEQWSNKNTKLRVLTMNPTLGIVLRLKKVPWNWPFCDCGNLC